MDKWKTPARKRGTAAGRETFEMALWPVECAGAARPKRQGERITSEQHDSTFHRRGQDFRWGSTVESGSNARVGYVPNATEIRFCTRGRHIAAAIWGEVDIQGDGGGMFPGERRQCCPQAIPWCDQMTQFGRLLEVMVEPSYRPRPEAPNATSDDFNKNSLRRDSFSPAVSSLVCPKRKETCHARPVRHFDGWSSTRLALAALA
jgi:hypothetical protein